MSRRAIAMRRGLPPMPSGVSVPADHRFRRPDQRPTRRRRVLQWTMRTTAAAIVLALVSVAAMWLARAVLDSSWLRVNHLVVTGTTRISAAEVETLLAGIRRQSILRVDFEQYRRRVLDSPWIADVTLWRRLPSTVEIRVRERLPMALARVGQLLYLVDAEGVIIDEYGPEHASFDLPIVSGLVAGTAAPGPYADPARVRLAGRFLAALAAAPHLRDRLSEIDVATDRDVAVILDGDPAVLHLGDGKFVERLAMYLDLAATVRAEVRDIDSVDLRYDDRMFVRPRGNKR